MSNIPVEYDPSISEEEKAAIKAMEQMFAETYDHQPLYWTSVVDSRSRRYLRAFHFRNRNMALGQFVPQDIIFTPSEDLRLNIINGQHTPTELE